MQYSVHLLTIIIVACTPFSSIDSLFRGTGSPAFPIFRSRLAWRLGIVFAALFSSRPLMPSRSFTSENLGQSRRSLETTQASSEDGQAALIVLSPAALPLNVQPTSLNALPMAF